MSTTELVISKPKPVLPTAIYSSPNGTTILSVCKFGVLFLISPCSLLFLKLCQAYFQNASGTPPLLQARFKEPSSL